MFFRNKKKSKWWVVTEKSFMYYHGHFFHDKELANKYAKYLKKNYPAVKISVKRWRG